MFLSACPIPKKICEVAREVGILGLVPEHHVPQEHGALPSSKTTYGITACDLFYRTEKTLQGKEHGSGGFGRCEGDGWGIECHFLNLAYY